MKSGFQPVIKWSGSKRSQSAEIVSRIPDIEYHTYYEPFCGGCSILYKVLQSKRKFKRYICSDLNGDLIALWNRIKTNPYDLASSYEIMWLELNSDNNIERKRKYFYSVRDRFNQYRNAGDFMFIMRTTTNGMPRYNRAGEFNNSFHLTRSGITPNKLRKLILEWSVLLRARDVQFIHQPYDVIQARETDFIYLDPPYANTKGMYYGALDYEKLWEWMRKQPCPYLLSFDGRGSTFDATHPVPVDLYDNHEYLYAGNSSFRRIVGKSNTEYVRESLYSRILQKGVV